ncbi:universal stress protein [Nocardia jiangsuensis]|uniref:Universal stress protein n=1 Tax=Nocardia jiangsuensis TaxID=1691563 RepID=A0ABV8DNP3_9NOCA
MTTATHRLATAPVVVGADGSDAALRAVGLAAEIAAARGRRLDIVHAVNTAAVRLVLGSYDTMIPSVVETMRAEGADMLGKARRIAADLDPNLVVETELVERGAADTLVERSAAAYLTVIGATGAGGTVAHLGSTLLAVVAHGHGSILVTRGEEHPTGPIVVGVDGSPASTGAVEAAFTEAAERKAPLVAVHTWSDAEYARFAGLPDLIEEPRMLADAESLLAEQLAGWSEKYPDVEVRRELRLSGPRHHLLDWSKRARLVVVGNRGRGGFTGLLLGSTGNALVQRAHCPVLVAHND